MEVRQICTQRTRRGDLAGCWGAGGGPLEISTAVPLPSPPDSRGEKGSNQSDRRDAGQWVGGLVHRSQASAGGRHQGKAPYRSRAEATGPGSAISRGWSHTSLSFSLSSSSLFYLLVLIGALIDEEENRQKQVKKLESFSFLKWFDRV